MAEPIDDRPSHLRGDGPCQDCGELNIVWFAPSVFWNAVMGNGTDLSDPGGIVCVSCFVARAEAKFRVTGWQLTPEWRWQEIGVAS